MSALREDDGGAGRETDVIERAGMIVRTAPAAVNRFADTSAREIGVVINAQKMGSDNLMIMSDGLDYRNYLENNATVLWAHDQGTVPVAKTIDIRRVGTEVHATTKFDEPGKNALADEVYNGIKFGSINAVSIGFVPLQDEPLRDVPFARRITKSRLLEISYVALPALDSAVVNARKLSLRAGKVLSAANEAELRAAHRQITDGHQMVAAGADQLAAVCDMANSGGADDASEDATDVADAAAAARAMRARQARAQYLAERIRRRMAEPRRAEFLRSGAP